MEVEFADDDLRRLEVDAAFNANLSRSIVSAYRRRMQAIRAANDERDLRVFRAWNFEKLKGDRSHQHSIRLNGQFRLIVEIIVRQPKNGIRVIEIVDYH